MKRIIFVFCAVYFLLGFSMMTFAAEGGKKSSSTSAGTAVTEDVGNVKKEAVKTVEATKNAIKRDAKSMKEEIPKDLKEARESAIHQSKDIQKSTTKELKEIRDNMTHPKLDKTGQK